MTKGCDKSKWFALDLIGTFGLLTVAFSIDELPMWVYAVDGEYIEPQKVDALAITSGERYSVLMKLETAGDYTIRIASTTETQMVAGYGTLSYRADDQEPFTRPSVPYINDVGANTTADVVFLNANTVIPYEVIILPSRRIRHLFSSSSWSAPAMSGRSTAPPTSRS